MLPLPSGAPLHPPPHHLYNHHPVRSVYDGGRDGRIGGDCTGRNTRAGQAVLSAVGESGPAHNVCGAGGRDGEREAGGGWNGDWGRF